MAADPRLNPERDERGRGGDPKLDRLLELFDRHYDEVFRFARRSVDDSTAEDVTQEVFTRLMRLADLHEREIRPAYLFTIASNLMKRRFQRERRLGEIVRSTAGRHAGSAETERAEDRAAGRAERASASRALETLSGRERDAVDLIVCRGLSYREAAESMGAKVSDVNNWRYRGVEHLRRDGTGGR